MSGRNFNRRSLLAGAGAASLGLAASGAFAQSATQPAAPAPAAAPEPDPPPPALKALFADRFRIGMALDPEILEQRMSRDLVLTHASSISAESVMKAQPISLGERSYDFSRADALIAFAQAHGIGVRGHNLVWHQTAPDWFFAGDTSDKAAYQAKVRRRLETYVHDVVTHFKGKVYCWDVINECTSDSASDVYRQSPWFKALGPDYIVYALKAARAADPDAALFINDYDTEHDEKRGRLLQIVRTARAAGAPLDGVGHQMHINTLSPSPAMVHRALTDVEGLGLINHVTELDVSIYPDPGSCFADRSTCLPSLRPHDPRLREALMDQARQYRAMFKVFEAHPSVKSVTFWGIADNHTWLDTFPVTRLNLPLLFAPGGQPKPAYWAVVDQDSPI